MNGHRLFLLGSAIVGLVVLALIVIGAVGQLSVTPWGNISGDDRSAAIAGSTRVGQQFIAPFPGLYRIEVMLDPTTVQNPQPATLRLQGETSGANPLAYGEFQTSDIKEDTPYSIEFPPIQDSAGRAIAFTFESPQSSPGDALTIHYDPDSILEGASATLNGQAVAGNLKFRTYYSLRTRDKLDILLARMAAGRPYMLGSKGFYVGLAVAYALVLGIFLWHVAQTILEDERK
jgi:hypothetical protein